MIRQSVGVEKQVLGKYELLGRLGMGGMAEIFRARHRAEAGFEKDVVIKRILPHLAEDEAFVRMFLDEAVLAAKLSHPNIVQVFDFRNEGGVYYIAMELVEGLDLKRLVGFAKARGLRLSDNQCVQIALGIVRGLGHAHDRVMHGMPLQIVHRDVSPHNVLVSLSGDVKVMDFGIAKAAARATQTKTGVIKGKVAYMAPEQARGEEVDARADIFATGLVLWELLAGRRAYTAENEMQLLRDVEAGAVPEITQLRPELPAELARCLTRFLARERDARYQRMRDAERDLAEILHALGSADADPLDAFLRNAVPEDVADKLRGIDLGGHTQSLPVIEAATAFTEKVPDRSRTASAPKAETLAPTEASAAQPPRTRAWALATAIVILAIAASAVMLLPRSRPEPVLTTVEPSPAPVVPQEETIPIPPPEEPSAPSEEAEITQTPSQKRAPKARPLKLSPPDRATISATRIELINCEPGSVVWIDRTPVGLISSANVNAFPFPAGHHLVEVRSSDDVSLGEATKLSLQGGEMDVFRCR